MSREEELYEMTNDELRSLLEEEDLSTSGNKDELVSRILHFELGVPEASDDAEESAEENGEAAATDADAQDTPPEDTAQAVESEEDAQASESTDEPTEESAEGEGERVLVKFLGGSSFHQTKGHTFSVEHPFGALTEEDAEALMQERPTLFRYARPAEAESYYS